MNIIDYHDVIIFFVRGIDFHPLSHFRERWDQRYTKANLASGCVVVDWMAHLTEYLLVFTRKSGRSYRRFETTQCSTNNHCEVKLYIYKYIL